MKTSTLLIGFIALALSACTTGKQESKSGEEASMSIVNAEAPESQPAPTPLEEVRAANDAFVDAFERGDFARAVEHYEEDAVWFLTNGMALRGRASIKGMLTKAHADGAGRFRFSELAKTGRGRALYHRVVLLRVHTGKDCRRDAFCGLGDEARSRTVTCERNLGFER